MDRGLYKVGWFNMGGGWRGWGRGRKGKPPPDECVWLDWLETLQLDSKMTKKERKDANPARVRALFSYFSCLPRPPPPLPPTLPSTPVLTVATILLTAAADCSSPLGWSTSVMPRWRRLNVMPSKMVSRVSVQFSGSSARRRAKKGLKKKIK